MTRLSFISAALAAMLTFSAQAADVTAGGLTISTPWSRATPKGAPAGVGYLTITNHGGTPDRLIGGQSDVSSRIEIHEMSMDNGIMRMRPMAQGIEIKPGETVALKPGGNHMMFVGLKGQLTQGQHVKATLSFEKAGKVDVEFSVESIGAQSAGSDHNMHNMSGDPGEMKHSH